MKKFDFSGWATRNNLKCSDGRTILKDAFKENDGQTVPLVWNHRHNEPYNVLGHALLENRDDGVYAYCTLNDTESGKNAKLLVEHGDVSALSIYANQLKQQGANVLHGAIREVSLVLAGANPGAFIDSVLAHGEESEEEGIIYTGEPLSLSHSDEKKEEKMDSKGSEEPETKKEEKKTEEGETVKEIFDNLSEKQKTVVYALVGEAMGKDGESDGGKKNEGGVPEQDADGGSPPPGPAEGADKRQTQERLCLWPGREVQYRIGRRHQPGAGLGICHAGRSGSPVAFSPQAPAEGAEAVSAPGTHQQGQRRHYLYAG